MVYAILVVLLLATQLMSSGYLKPTHVAGILRLASFMGIAAISRNLTILTGGIDLSIANTITSANVIMMQIMMGRNENLSVTLFAVIVMGVVVGFINGVGIYWFKISPLIMTLGVRAITQDVSLIYIKGASKGSTSPLLKVIYGQSFIGISSDIVVIWTVMAAVTIVLLRNTPYGRKVYSAGTNERAARFSRVHTGRVTFSAYPTSVVMAAVSGFSLVGYTGASFLDVGTSYNTKATAAVTIGGAAITGEKGGYIGTITGTVVMTIPDDSLTIVNIPEAGRQIVQGVIVVLLVLIYSREKRKK